jgi:hypothetical protein
MRPLVASATMDLADFVEDLGGEQALTAQQRAWLQSCGEAKLSSTPKCLACFAAALTPAI